MEQKSLKTNAIWNFIYTGSNILFPMITAPYITRVLGATNLGLVDFSRSFVQWFVLFASFGIPTYGVRAIAQSREKKEKLNKVYSELFILNLLFSLFSTIVYLIVIFSIDDFNSERKLFIIMTFMLIFNAVNIDWFYQGIEEYSYITKRNFVVKIASLLCMLMFVKESDDYLLYGLISIMAISFSGIFNVINSRNYVKFTFKEVSIMKHLKPLVTFFAITFIISIYTNLDATLLGFMDEPSSVAYLTRSKLVISLAGTVATSITAVTMPRTSYYLLKDFNKYIELIKIATKYMLFLTIPIVIGIIMLSPEIMYIIGGKEFMDTSQLLALIALSIVFSTLSLFLHQQVIIASGNERYGLIASIISSLVSIVTNIVLIPMLSYIGAGIAYALSEFCAFCTRYFYTKRIGYNFIKVINKSTLSYLFASIIMCIPIIMIKNTIDNLFFVFIFSASIGAIVYFAVLIILKEEIIMLNLRRFINKNRRN